MGLLTTIKKAFTQLLAETGAAQPQPTRDIAAVQIERTDLPAKLPRASLAPALPEPPERVHQAVPCHSLEEAE